MTARFEDYRTTPTWHRISNVDPTNCRATCSVCGPNTGVRNHSSGGARRWVCLKAKRECAARNRREAELRVDRPTACVFCGYNRCTRSIDMHHVHPEEKSFNTTPEKRRIELLVAEYAKCISVCRNCHGEIHAGIITQAEVEAKPRVVVHPRPYRKKPEGVQKSETQRKLVKARKEAGVCVRCSKPPVKGKFKCEACAAKMALANAKQRRKRKRFQGTQRAFVF